MGVYLLQLRQEFPPVDEVPAVGFDTDLYVVFQCTVVQHQWPRWWIVWDVWKRRNMFAWTFTVFFSRYQMLLAWDWWRYRCGKVQVQGGKQQCHDSDLRVNDVSHSYCSFHFPVGICGNGCLVSPHCLWGCSALWLTVWFEEKTSSSWQSAHCHWCRAGKYGIERVGEWIVGLLPESACPGEKWAARFVGLISAQDRTLPSRSESEKLC